MAVSRDSACTGQLLHYQLGQCLGEGGFGQVYQAWDSKLQRQVAIKVLKNTVMGMDLLQEARLTASLHHPCFVKIHALEQIDQIQAIVMELVPGRTVRRALEEKAYDLANDLPHILDMVCQIAQAMQEAHLAGLTHGDLKPSNLMQEPNGTIRILDFGLAAQADSEATMSLIQSDPQGTIAYMAPERLTGAALRPSSDIYALGVILYELLIGNRPFADLSGLALAAALMQSRSEQWPWPETLPLSLRQLVRAMTASQLSERLGSMQEVAIQCAQLAGRQIPPAPQMSSPSRPQTIPQPPVAGLAGFSQRWRGPSRIMPWVALLVVALALWQLLPYWYRLSANLQPYSESQEMSQGLQALASFDRHEMLDRAARHFGSILQHAPEHAAALASMALVNSYRYENDDQNRIWLEQAQTHAQQALKLNDLLALSHLANARVQVLRGQPVAALASQEKGMALNPDSHLAWRIKVEALLLAKRFDEALQLATQALQRFPQEWAFANQIGQIHLLQASYPAAQVAYRQSIALKPDGVLAYMGLAQALSGQHRADEALQALQTGLKVKPGSALYGALGKALFSRGDYVGAVEAFEKAVKPEQGKPDEYTSWINLANSLLWIPGRGEDAQKAYRQARALLAPRLQQSPEDPDLLSRLALYAAKLGEHTEALAQLERALRLAPANPEVQFRAGVSYELLGQRRAALTAIANARQMGFAMKKIEEEPELVALRRDPVYIKSVKN